MMFVQVVVAALLASGTAAAQEAQTPAQPPAKEKKVCRSVVATGSIMAKRICLTKAEWAKMNADNEKHADMYRERQNRNSQPGTMD